MGTHRNAAASPQSVATTAATPAASVGLHSNEEPKLRAPAAAVIISAAAPAGVVDGSGNEGRSKVKKRRSHSHLEATKSFLSDASGMRHEEISSSNILVDTNDMLVNNSTIPIVSSTKTKRAAKFKLREGGRACAAISGEVIDAAEAAEEGGTGADRARKRRKKERANLPDLHAGDAGAHTSRSRSSSHYGSSRSSHNVGSNSSHTDSSSRSHNQDNSSSSHNSSSSRSSCLAKLPSNCSDVSDGSDSRSTCCSSPSREKDSAREADAATAEKMKRRRNEKAANSQTEIREGKKDEKEGQEEKEEVKGKVEQESRKKKHTLDGARAPVAEADSCTPAENCLSASPLLTAEAANGSVESAAAASGAAAAATATGATTQLISYRLTATTLAVLRQQGIEQLLPIQAATFTAVYSRRDLIGRADTGTGKTLAFALPLVERLVSLPTSTCGGSRASSESCNALISGSRSSSRGGRLAEGGGRGRGGGVGLLVLLPTRELAQQVHAEFVLLLQGRLRTACMYGGGGGGAAARQQQQSQGGRGRQAQVLQQQQEQQEDLRRGRCSILVGCPGRVKDIINRGLLQEGAALQSVVLDEADRLLDMGFREDVEEILSWCSSAWRKAHGGSTAAAEKEKKKESAAGEGERRKEGEMEKARLGDAVQTPSSAHVSSSSCSSSTDATLTSGGLQFLLFTATLPHWARSIASRFMRADRLLIDAAALQGSCSSSSGGGIVCNIREGGAGTALRQQQQKSNSSSSSNNGIKYLVLFCPRNNRMRILEDVLTVYGGFLEAAGNLSAATLASSASSPPRIAFGRVSSGSSAAAAAVAVPSFNAGKEGKRGTSTAATAAAVIFADTKQQVNAIALESGLRRLAAPLHGDLPQQQRETTLQAFKAGCFPYLVATDVAARGLHVDSLPLVVQLSPPRDLDAFVHRAGRTGRAGKAGVCLTFAAVPDIPTLLTLEKKLRMQFERVGVPQPAGIQRRLLDMQLQFIIPEAEAARRHSSSSSSSTAAESNSFVGGGSVGKSRRGQSEHEQATGSDNDSRSRTKSGKSRKCCSYFGEDGKKSEDENDVDEEVEEAEEEEEGQKAARKSGGPSAISKCREEVAAGPVLEEQRQILIAADRVLQALPPREAVTRCLTLLLRHATAGTASAAVAFENTVADAAAAAVQAGADEATSAADSNRLSCLNGREGFRTYELRLREQPQQQQLQQKQENCDGGLLRSPGAVWRLLKGTLLYKDVPAQRGGPTERIAGADRVEELLERINCLTLAADKRGAVFDIAAADVAAFEAHVISRCCCGLAHSRGGEAAPTAGKRKSAAGGGGGGKRGEGVRAKKTRQGRAVVEEEEEGEMAGKIPFIIQEAEELPLLVDTLALRRSEQEQDSRHRRGGGGGSSNDGSYMWNGGRNSSSSGRGGGYSNARTQWGGERGNSSFRSGSGFAGRVFSHNGRRAESWTSRHNHNRAGSSSSSSRGRGGGGGGGERRGGFSSSGGRNGGWKN